MKTSFPESCGETKLLRGVYLFSNWRPGPGSLQHNLKNVEKHLICKSAIIFNIFEIVFKEVENHSCGFRPWPDDLIRHLILLSAHY